MTVLTEDVPRVDTKDCVAVDKFPHGFYRIVLHYGFMEDPDLLRTLSRIERDEVSLDLSKATFFLGKETILPAADVPGMALWREKLFSFLSNNSRSATEFFSLPVERVVEIRGQVKI